MICGYCGEAFQKDTGQPACASCPVSRGCGKVRCPRCGWENPEEPRFIQVLRNWTSRRKNDARSVE